MKNCFKHRVSGYCFFNLFIGRQRRIISLIIFFSFFSDLSFSQENRKSYAFIIGLCNTGINSENYPVNEFYTDFPNNGFSTVNYSGFEYDSKSYTSSGGQMFFNYVAFEFAAPFKNKKQKIFDRTDWRIKMAASFAAEETYYSNLEKITDVISYSGGEMVTRDFYSVMMYMDVYSASYSWIHKSNYKFKKQRTRLFVGMGINSGIAVQQGYFTHLYGRYFIADGEGDKTHNYYFFPHETYWEEREQRDEKLGSRFFTGFEIPFGIEMLFGRKERFHCGFTYYMGALFLTGGSKSTLSAGYFSGGLSLRWDVGTE